MVSPTSVPSSHSPPSQASSAATRPVRSSDVKLPAELMDLIMSFSDKKITVDPRFREHAFNQNYDITPLIHIGNQADPQFVIDLVKMLFSKRPLPIALIKQLMLLALDGINSSAHRSKVLEGFQQDILNTADAQETCLDLYTFIKDSPLAKKLVEDGVMSDTAKFEVAYFDRILKKLGAAQPDSIGKLEAFVKELLDPEKRSIEQRQAALRSLYQNVVTLREPEGLEVYHFLERENNRQGLLLRTKDEVSDHLTTWIQNHKASVSLTELTLKSLQDNLAALEKNGEDKSHSGWPNLYWKFDKAVVCLSRLSSPFNLSTWANTIKNFYALCPDLDPKCQTLGMLVLASFKHLQPGEKAPSQVDDYRNHIARLSQRNDVAGSTCDSCAYQLLNLMEKEIGAGLLEEALKTLQNIVFENQLAAASQGASSAIRRLALRDAVLDAPFHKRLLNEMKNLALKLWEKGDATRATSLEASIRRLCVSERGSDGSVDELKIILTLISAEAERDPLLASQHIQQTESDHTLILGWIGVAFSIVNKLVKIGHQREAAQLVTAMETRSNAYRRYCESHNIELEEECKMVLISQLIIAPLETWNTATRERVDNELLSEIESLDSDEYSSVVELLLFTHSRFKGLQEHGQAIEALERALQWGISNEGLDYDAPHIFFSALKREEGGLTDLMGLIRGFPVEESAKGGFLGILIQKYMASTLPDKISTATEILNASGQMFLDRAPPYVEGVLTLVQFARKLVGRERLVMENAQGDMHTQNRERELNQLTVVADNMLAGVYQRVDLISWEALSRAKELLDVNLLKLNLDSTFLERLFANGLQAISSEAGRNQDDDIELNQNGDTERNQHDLLRNLLILVHHFPSQIASFQATYAALQRHIPSGSEAAVAEARQKDQERVLQLAKLSMKGHQYHQALEIIQLLPQVEQQRVMLADLINGYFDAPQAEMEPQDFIHIQRTGQLLEQLVKTSQEDGHSKHDDSSPDLGDFYPSFFEAFQNLDNREAASKLLARRQQEIHDHAKTGDEAGLYRYLFDMIQMTGLTARLDSKQASLQLHRIFDLLEGATHTSEPPQEPLELPQDSISISSSSNQEVEKPVRLSPEGAAKLHEQAMLTAADFDPAIIFSRLSEKQLASSKPEAIAQLIHCILLNRTGFININKAS